MAIKIGLEDYNERQFDLISSEVEVVKCQVDLNRVFFTKCYLHVVSSSLIWGKDVDSYVDTPYNRTLVEGVNLIVLRMMEKVLQ